MFEEGAAGDGEESGEEVGEVEGDVDAQGCEGKAGAGAQVEVGGGDGAEGGDVRDVPLLGEGFGRGSGPGWGGG